MTTLAPRKITAYKYMKLEYRDHVLALGDGQLGNMVFDSADKAIYKRTITVGPGL